MCLEFGELIDQHGLEDEGRVLPTVTTSPMMQVLIYRSFETRLVFVPQRSSYEADRVDGGQRLAGMW